MAKHKANPYLIPRMTPEQVQALQGLRASGAAGKHADRRTKRNRTRAAQRRNALKEW
jgi:hypothetical protein